MSVEGVLQRVVETLSDIGIPYMLTGSLASSYYGRPRTTQDIDIVIAPDSAQLKELVRMFPDSQYYVDEGAALEALDRESMFNLIDFKSGWKVDFIIRKSRDFSRAEFERRAGRELYGVNVAIASPEDVVVAKLEWAKMGESSRQVDDAAAILRSRRTSLDMAYIEKWVGRLDLGAQWQQVLDGASPESDR